MGDSTFEGRLAPTDRRKVDVTLLTQIATVISNLAEIMLVPKVRSSL